MILNDPKTFAEFAKRSKWGPWVLALVVAILAGILLFAVLVLERDPAKRFAPIDSTAQRAWTIALALIVLAFAIIAPFWSRRLHILYSRGQRARGTIESMAVLPKKSARLVQIAYQVGGRTYYLKRDVPIDQIEALQKTGLVILYDPQQPERADILPPGIAQLPLK